MLLAIDIGNSSTKFGIFESSSLIDKFVIPTVRDYTVDELLFDRLRYVHERFFRIDTVVITSVVPEINNTFAQASLELLKVTPVFVDHTFDFGVKINYDPVTSIGTDRLVNVASAAAKYGSPVIACSFGTATTIDAVDKDAIYVGGIIAPGMKMLAEALHIKTSKLPLVAIEEPDAVIGNSTEASIRSGVFYGYLGLVEGLLERIVAEIEGDPQIVATGGFAGTVGNSSSLIDVVDENLTLEGLRLLMERRTVTS